MFWNTFKSETAEVMLKQAEIKTTASMSAIGNNESRDLDTQLETDTSSSKIDLVKSEEAHSKIACECLRVVEKQK
ncbi:hypothetical protein RclHR1_02680026 [Rhizophagus clarus]|uniref:Uncharacterized protein n=1 Tax=Rhizophagus clarus TaxID=94130 RepID=A0A2Z6R5H7_9GLOM|nr:hypothetical protein RclHR1_02680026 [Rhizophagus clarus]GES86491.1 hypothetical protein GLOIN_2v1728285 [Rhizophagus clarus]